MSNSSQFQNLALEIEQGVFFRFILLYLLYLDVIPCFSCTATYVNVFPAAYFWELVVYLQEAFLAGQRVKLN